MCPELLTQSKYRKQFTRACGNALAAFQRADYSVKRQALTTLKIGPCVQKAQHSQGCVRGRGEKIAGGLIS